MSDVCVSREMKEAADVIIFVHCKQYYLERDKPPDSPMRADWLERLNKVEDRAKIPIAKHQNNRVLMIANLGVDRASEPHL